MTNADALHGVWPVYCQTDFVMRAVFIVKTQHFALLFCHVTKDSVFLRHICYKNINISLYVCSMHVSRRGPCVYEERVMTVQFYSLCL